MVCGNLIFVQTTIQLFKPYNSVLYVVVVFFLHLHRSNYYKYNIYNYNFIVNRDKSLITEIILRIYKFHIIRMKYNIMIQ